MMFDAGVADDAPRPGASDFVEITLLNRTNCGIVKVVQGFW